MAEPTHYEVLALPQSLLDDTKPDQIPVLIKQAYHRALLRHHPDKAPQSHAQHSTPIATTHHHHNQPTYTIDQITTAHTTLSNPALRAKYDAQLRLSTENSRFGAGAGSSSSAAFQTGVETVDLDDLACDDGGWYRSCRCGNDRGFAFGEDDLEEAGDLGELLVGCADCSLWLRVCFAVVVDEEDDDGLGDGSGGGDGKGAGGSRG